MWLKEQYHKRPLWIQAILLFCLYMALIYTPWDLFIKPIAEDQDVWFGYMFTGWSAKITGAAHWVVYALGAWGFWYMKKWLHPWAALYVLQIAASMLIWSLLYRESDWWQGLIAALLFVALAYFLIRNKEKFTG